MQLVVVMAVRKAVSAATITFTATSMTRFFIIVHYQLSIINCEALVFVQSIIVSPPESSGITTLKANAADGWYDLQGRKLDTTPTQKGLYILNGHKVVIK